MASGLRNRTNRPSYRAILGLKPLSEQKSKSKGRGKRSVGNVLPPPPEEVGLLLTPEVQQPLDHELLDESQEDMGTELEELAHELDTEQILALAAAKEE